MKIVEPGLIATDLGGRSFDFTNNESMVEYQGIVNKLMGSFESLSANASPASVVANVIYQAATDGTDQLRYTAGEDAKVIIANRKAADDATFLQGIRDQFGL